MKKINLLPKYKKIAEQKIRNVSFLFELEPMEQAIIELQTAVRVKPSTNMSLDNAYAYEGMGKIKITKKFEELPPLDKVSTLIHEFVHSYNEISHTGADHDKRFLHLYNSILKNNYTHIKGGEYHVTTAGGLRYMLLNKSLENAYAILCPKCKKVVTIKKENLKCNCGYEFIHV